MPGIVTTSMHVPAESEVGEMGQTGSFIQSTAELARRSRRRTTCPLPDLPLAFLGGDVVLSKLEVLSWVCPEDDVLVCVVLVLPE